MITNNFSFLLSRSFLSQESQVITEYVQKLEKKLKSKTQVDQYFYKTLIHEAQNFLENIEVVNDEFDILQCLETICVENERAVMKLKLKRRQMDQENVWIRSQITDFYIKIENIHHISVKIEAEVYKRQYLFKMRFPNRSLFGDDSDSWNYEMSTPGNPSVNEPDEIYSPELRPFCNIVKHHMMDYHNELAISWCINLIEIYVNKEGVKSKNVADLYTFVGRIYKASDNFDKADFCFRKSLDILEHHQNVDNEIGINWSLLGNLNEQYDAFESATKCYTKALHFREGMMGSFHPDIIELYIRLSYITNKAGQFNDSIKYLIKVIHQVDFTCETDDTGLTLAHLILSDNYIELNDKHNAYFHLNKVCDTIKCRETRKKVVCKNPLQYLFELETQGIDEGSLYGTYMLEQYDKIQRCCHFETIRIIWKFFYVFHYKIPLENLQDWCDVSLMDYRMIESHFSKKQPVITKPKLQFTRSESLDTLVAKDSTEKPSHLKLTNLLRKADSNLALEPPIPVRQDSTQSLASLFSAKSLKHAIKSPFRTADRKK